LENLGKKRLGFGLAWQKALFGWRFANIDSDRGSLPSPQAEQAVRRHRAALTALSLMRKTAGLGKAARKRE